MKTKLAIGAALLAAAVFAMPVTAGSSRGTVSGAVIYDGRYPAAHTAIVFQLSTDPATTVTAVSNSAGHYKVRLPIGTVWTIELAPGNPECLFGCTIGVQGVFVSGRQVPQDIPVARPPR